MNRRSFFWPLTSVSSAEDSFGAFSPDIMPDLALVSEFGLEEHVAPLTQKTAAHLLRRTGFQYTPNELQNAVGKTAKQVVEQLLSPSVTSGIKEPAWAKNAPANNFNTNNAQNRELQLLWFEQFQIGSPLLEKTTFFWHNLLTSDSVKVYYSQFMYWQNDLFRRNAKSVNNSWRPTENNDREFFGNIKTMIKAIVRDPAMLAYLDNGVSVAGNPNENFARELLELYALGIGYYTEHDVVEAARALTGWRIEGIGSNFRQQYWDAGEKEFLGKVGNFGAEEIVDVIFDQPQCARFFAKRLYQFFVYHVPDESILDELANVIINENFQLRPILSTLLTSKHFFDEQFFGALIKTPLDVVVGTGRLFEVAGLQPSYGIEAMRALNLDLLNPPDVEGYKGYHQWITTTSLPTRQKFANGFVDGKTYDGKNAPELAINISNFIKNFPEAISAEEVIEAVSDYLLALPLSDTVKKGWIDDIFGGYDWTINSANANAEAKIRLLLREMMQTPEFQLI